MSTHSVRVVWDRGERPFTYEGYSREHRITFGGGASIHGSAAPEYRGDASLPNPEEALVSALSTCHMLSFLAIAAKKRLPVDHYSDAAEGHLAKNAEGMLAITTCILRPNVRFSPGTTVDEATLRAMHDLAHHHCFIAQSVKTDVRVEPAR